MPVNALVIIAVAFIPEPVTEADPGNQPQGIVVMI